MLAHGHNQTIPYHKNHNKQNHTMTRTSSQGKNTGRKKASPGKAKLEAPSNKGESKARYIIRCLTFEETFPFEAYIFEKVGDNKDGFLNGMLKHVEGTTKIDYLTSYNFKDLVPRRVPNSNNDIMKDKKGFWRKIILRFPQNEDEMLVPSTPQTRTEGLAILKRFFTDKQHSDFAPLSHQIITSDETNEEEDPPPLDAYFTDPQIRLLMMNYIEAKELNETFAKSWTSLAPFIWSGKHCSPWARTLGFPLDKEE